jgi:hypothetical protein
MNSRFTTTKVLLILILLATLTLGYSGRTGTFPHQKTQPTGVYLVPSDSDVRDTNTIAEVIVPGVGSTAPPFPRPGASWPWLLLGLLTGWLVGGRIRRHRPLVVRKDVRVPKRDEVEIRHDRAA